MTLHRLLDELFHGWNLAGVDWALLRVPGDLEVPEGDVDLLLTAEAVPPALEVAKRLGFVRVPRDPPDLHLLQYHRPTGRFIWLHCATDLMLGPFGGVRPVAASLLAARQQEGAVFRLHPSDEFWLSLAHALLDQQRLSEKSRRRLQSTAGAARVDALPAGLEAAVPTGWTPAGMVKDVRLGEWASIERAIPDLLRRCAEAGRPALPRRVIHACSRRLRRATSAWRRRGISVALLGPDGAGKSTLAANLQSSFPLPSRLIYMGLTGGWLRHVDRLRVPGIVRLGRLFIIWSRYGRGVYHTLRGRLVVYDRYVYDAAVPTPHPLSPLRRLGRWMDGRSCPPPDLVLILDAPGDVMHRRKAGYTAEMLESWRGKFRSLERRLRRVAVLDTTLSPDGVRAEATQRIWERYVSRWGEA